MNSFSVFLDSVRLYFSLLSFSPQVRSQTGQGSLFSLVNRLNGTAGRGAISPFVVMPFGMVQLGSDTRKTESGFNYPYKKTTITHKKLLNAKLRFVMAAKPGNWFEE